MFANIEKTTVYMLLKSNLVWTQLCISLFFYFLITTLLVLIIFNLGFSQQL